jgi:DNA modification methylase
MSIVNPRIKNPNTWYSYYAGYSADFVESIIEKLNIQTDSLILDPWNGSGTTTTVAFRKGIPAIGVDINPATIAVAKSRILYDVELEDIKYQCELIIDGARDRVKDSISDDDMLLSWFSYESAQIIRSIEKSIANIFEIENGLHLEELKVKIGSVASFFYVALYCTAKHYLNKCKSKNPTWTKIIQVDSLNIDEVYVVYSAYVEKNYNALPEVKNKLLRVPSSIIKSCSSNDLKIDDETVNFIITSPPYCTRIDYAVTTKVELAVLGFPASNFEELRNRMIGTTTIHCNDCKIDEDWGNEIYELLRKIDDHPSYASSNYYFKTYWQYFNDCFSSLCELNRVLKNDGYAVIVVQDSYYKEIHVDLAKMFAEMAYNLGWESVDTIEFKKNQSIVSINSKSNPFGKTSKRVETVLIFRK